jgi:guanyl-specific ribonuclease Sa
MRPALLRIPIALLCLALGWTATTSLTAQSTARAPETRHDRKPGARALAANRKSYPDSIVGHDGKPIRIGPTLDRIARGGTFPHRNDGTEFSNFPNRRTGAMLLPRRPRGYYTEYVHPTPGVSGPGAQRIIIGKNGEAYFTPDHYDSVIPIPRKE